MLVFLDQKNYKLTIYTNEGTHSVSLSNISAIRQIIGNNKVLYVTNAIETNITDILEVAESVIQQSGNATEKEEPTYLRTTLKGKLVFPIEGLTTTITQNGKQIIEERKLVFDGPLFLYPLTRLYFEFGEDVFEKHPIFQNMINKNKLQLVTASEAEKLKFKYSKQQQKEQEMKDKQLDSIIVDDKVSDYIDSYGDDSNPDSHDNVIEIDVRGGGRGGMATNNEGSLLPDDF